MQLQRPRLSPRARRWRTLLALGLFVASAATSARAVPCQGPACGGTLVLIGTHGAGPGQGIFAARLDPQSGALTALGLAAQIERPTWLVRDPSRPLIYAASETGNDGKSQGGVYSLAIDRGAGKLKILARSDSGGGGATHLAYDPGSRTIFVANYGGGQVTALPVGPDGELSGVSSTQQNTGSGPNKRQKGPHAHGVTIDPTGQYVLSPDLGADKVFVYHWDRAGRKLGPAATPFLSFVPGSGPRHLVFSPHGKIAFLDTELTGEVMTLRWDAKTGQLSQLAKVALDAPDYTGTRSAAEIAISADGRFLYVSNRGANAVQVFTVDPRSGALAQVQSIDCGGKVPWSFAIDPTGHWLVVTNEASSNLAVFAVDRSTGKLTATGQSLAVPKPVALAFVP